MPDFPSFPNEAALRAIERRGRRFEPSGYWWTVWQRQHQTAFTVAQSAGYDILADIYAALHEAMRTGMAYQEFESNLMPILQKKGWWGRTEDGRQLGAPWRLKTIFQQNLRVSAAQGEWEEIQELKKKRPYLRYTALVDGRTRPLHKSWHGTILPVDDPWWETHFPPNGWNCRCKVVSVSEAELEFYGWKVSARAPEDGYREWLNPATGQIMRVPNGIDPGWDYNPGNTDQAAHAAKLAMDRLAAMPPEMGAFAITALAVSFPQVERELKGWIGRITDQIAKGVVQPTGDRRIVGALPGEAIRFARDNGIELATAAISIGDRDLMHALRTGKFEPLPVEVWENLPDLLLNPEAVYWEKEKPGFVYLLEDKSGKVIVLVNYEIRHRGKLKVTNSIHTGRRIISVQEFEDYKHYVKIK